MRLIDADELMIILQDHCGVNCMYTEQERQNIDICDSCLLGDAKDYIDRMPTIEAVPVVWCKDCIHREQYDCNHIMLGNTKCGVTDDWFCADGERREEDDSK